LQCSNEKRAFYQFELGVRCSSPGKINISVRGAQKILGKVQDTKEIFAAAAAVYGELSAIDRAFVEIEFRKQGWKKEDVVACSEVFKLLDVV
jgi:hypothetical protein